MMHKQYSDKISDYVMGVLDSAEIQPLEAHIASCAECYQRLQQERSIGQAVKGTLSAMPLPNHAQLMRMMPAAPARRSRLGFVEGWQRAVALTAAFAALITANLGLQLGDRSASITVSPMPAQIVLTTTATRAPTMTPTRLAFTTLTPLATPMPAMNSR